MLDKKEEEILNGFPARNQSVSDVKLLSLCKVTKNS